MVTSCHHSSNVGEGVFAEIRTQRVLEGLVFVLRQPFFDREYNGFRQHELRRGRCQPRDHVGDPLRRQRPGRRGLVRFALLARLGREGPQLVAIAPG